jgi:hypothetical protein
MNERIKLLSLAASDTIPDDASVEHALYLFQKNFAELIVRECADICLEQRQYQPKEVYAQAVLSHFGVEE